jgi:hypothetical protein
MEEQKKEESWTVDVNFEEVKSRAQEIVNMVPGSRDRRTEVHRGLGMILAGLVIVESCGAFRTTVSEWLKKIVNVVFGILH